MVFTLCSYKGLKDRNISILIIMLISIDLAKMNKYKVLRKFQIYSLYKINALVPFISVGSKYSTQLSFA